MITLRQMRYFEALATTRHFGRAAALVHVSQPALSAQIKEMEETLGVRLVERSRGATFITREGEDVLTHVRAILNQMELLEQSVRKGGGVLERLVRIGIIPTVAPYLVPHLVPRLRTTYPLIEIELKEAVTNRLINELCDGALDAAIVALPVDAEGMVSRPLFSDRFFIAVAANERDVLTSPLTQSEVNVDRLLLLEEGHCLREQALAVCQGAGKRSLVNFGATSMATLLQMVAHGMGMTLIPEMAIPTEIGRNTIRVVPFADPQPVREIGLVWRRSNPHIQDMQALAETVVACASGVEAV